MISDKLDCNAPNGCGLWIQSNILFIVSILKERTDSHPIDPGWTVVLPDNPQFDKLVASSSFHIYLLSWWLGLTTDWYVCQCLCQWLVSVNIQDRKPCLELYQRLLSEASIQDAFPPDLSWGKVHIARFRPDLSWYLKGALCKVKVWLRISLSSAVIKHSAGRTSCIIALLSGANYLTMSTCENTHWRKVDVWKRTVEKSHTKQCSDKGF